MPYSGSAYNVAARIPKFVAARFVRRYLVFGEISAVLENQGNLEPKVNGREIVCMCRGFQDGATLS